MPSTLLEFRPKASENVATFDMMLRTSVGVIGEDFVEPAEHPARGLAHGLARGLAGGQHRAPAL